MALQNTLNQFQAFILQDRAGIENEVVGVDSIRQERLDVYYQGYFLRLMETLGRAFPVVKKLAGEELFDRIGREYIRRHPSHHFSIRFFGRHFSSFLAAHPEAQPVWSEVAAFEWVLGAVIDAADAPQLTLPQLAEAQLTAEAWSDLTLQPHPSVQLLPLHYPAVALWQAVQRDAATHPTIERQEQPTHWLIWRFDLRSYFVSLSAEQLTMLRAIQAEQTFSEVCSELCTLLGEEQVVEFTSQTLRQWITEGVFSRFTIKPTESAAA